MKSTASCKALARTLALAGIFCAAVSAENLVRLRIDLNGAWQFRLGSQVSFRDSLQVPGCWQAQGIGERSGNPRHHYAGTARRQVASGTAGLEVLEATACRAQLDHY